MLRALQYCANHWTWPSSLNACSFQACEMYCCGIHREGNCQLQLALEVAIRNLFLS